MSIISASTTSTTAYKVTADTTGTLVLQTGATPTTAMTINASQQVGIGTSSPSAPLAIGRVNSVEEGGQIDLCRSTDNASAWGIDVFGSTSTPSLRFIDNIAAATRMSIDGSGNLGVGATPSAWNTFKGLQIAGGSLMSYSNAYLDLFQNVYYDGASLKYVNTGYASYYRQYNGEHTWYYAASGTAGNSISMSQAMTITNSGNLLVGIASQSFHTLYKDNGNNWACRIQNPNATGYGLEVFLSGNPNNTTQEGFRVEDANAIRMRVFSNGNVQNVNNSYGAISDIKLKENITDATPKLAQLQQVRVVNYNLIGESTKQLGVIAQELEQVFPSMVDESPDYEEVTTTDEEGNEKTERVATGTTTKSVKYSIFVPMLIKAIQEQQAIITTLTNRITALESK